MRVIFSTNDVHPRDRLDSWREEASKASVGHDCDPRVESAFQGRIRTGTLGTLALTIIESDACTVRRTKRYIEQASDDDLLLSLQLAGNLVLHQDGRDAITKPQDVFLLDPRRPFSVDVDGPVRTLIVKLPRWELQSRLGDVRTLTARPISQAAPLGALAGGFLAMLPERVDAFDEATGSKVAQQVIDLVALTLGQELQDGRGTISTSRMTTLLRLKNIIEGRLIDPDLRPAQAAAAAGISVRYANALLGHEGTSLERFIMLRRLLHCRRLLEDSAQAFRTVSDIAYSYGFSDMSHFTRRFKAQFGCSPSACRQQALTAAMLSPSA
jgi:AraC family transcriptional regulator, positive regulator of tynA and feaB